MIEHLMIMKCFYLLEPCF